MCWGGGGGVYGELFALLLVLLRIYVHVKAILTFLLVCVLFLVSLEGDVLCDCYIYWNLLYSFVYFSLYLKQTADDNTIILFSFHKFCADITKTCLYNVDSLKPHFYIVKMGFTGAYIIFLISAQKHRLWVLVRTA